MYFDVNKEVLYVMKVIDFFDYIANAPRNKYEVAIGRTEGYVSLSVLIPVQDLLKEKFFSYLNLPKGAKDAEDTKETS